jgi:phosphoserine phosphatase RsbU/P
MRILIAEDDAVSRRLLQWAVEQAGHETLVAADGEAAWACFQQEAVDTIISDWMMPGLDGVALCRLVRASARPVYPYVILLTALADREHLLAGLAAGADDYLAKPLDRDELRVRLTTAERVTSLYRRLEEQHRRLQAELARAGQVQADLLPAAAPVLAGFDIAARCVPARTVGGDFYDWQELGAGVLALTVGDVMGKGMPAALLMATVRAALRAASGEPCPAETVRRTSGAVAQDLARAESYVTLFRARLDAARRHLDFVDAGHGLVVLRRASGTWETLQPRLFPLGVPPTQTYVGGRLSMQPGDTLAIYSDGLVEPAGDGPLERAVVAAQLDSHTSAAGLVSRLMAAVPVPGADDATVVVVCCRATAGCD